MIKFVWDTSAILSIKELNQNGYSPGNSIYKDIDELCFTRKKKYQFIFPSISIFELNSSVSRKHRDGESILRDFYIFNDSSITYPVDQDLLNKCHKEELFTKDGFNKLRGADLVFACIAYIEGAYLITLDNHFGCIVDAVKVINLNESRSSAQYYSQISEII